MSLGATYPGTYLYDQAKANGWLREANQGELVAGDGVQVSALSYPHLSDREIFEAVSTFYRRFYFRPSKIAEMTAEMLTSREMLVRRLREGGEFFKFLLKRRNEAVEAPAPAMRPVSAASA